MLFNTAVLALVGAASAVDLVFWDTGDCTGRGMACQNWNPDVCCDNVAGVSSISIQAVPLDWNLVTYGYSDRCNNQINLFATFQTDRGCMAMPADSNQKMTSAKYSFGPKSLGSKARRRRRADSGEKGECREVHRPDLMFFSDGVKYNLTALDEDTYKKMVCYPPLAKQHLIFF